MSIAAYQQAVKRHETPRETEWRAFQTVTSALVRVVEEKGQNAAARVEAISRNRTLWALLADDCAQPDNQLPAPLRGQIVSLALWVNRASREAMTNLAAVTDLITVNRSIMEGLSGRP